VKGFRGGKVIIFRRSKKRGPAKHHFTGLRVVVGGLGLRGRRYALILSMDLIEHLLAVHGHLFGRHDTKANFVAADLHHRYGDVIVDHDAFVFLPTQY